MSTDNKLDTWYNPLTDQELFWNGEDWVENFVELEYVYGGRYAVLVNGEVYGEYPNFIDAVVVYEDLTEGV